MGSVIDFSSAKFLDSASSIYCRACLVDTNFLIALAYEPHKFHEDAQAFYEKLVQGKVPIYISLSVRSEFLDFERRIIATEQLLGMLAKDFPWKITQTTRQKLTAQKFWADQQSAKEELPILPDSRIKDCKKLFTPLRASGHHGWLDFCDYYFKNLIERWEKSSEAWGLNYLRTRETENSDLFQRKIQWKSLYELSAKTCLGSFVV